MGLLDRATPANAVAGQANHPGLCNHTNAAVNAAAARPATDDEIADLKTQVEVLTDGS